MKLFFGEIKPVISSRLPHVVFDLRSIHLFYTFLLLFKFFVQNDFFLFFYTKRFFRLNRIIIKQLKSVWHRSDTFISKLYRFRFQFPNRIQRIFKIIFAKNLFLFLNCIVKFLILFNFNFRFNQGWSRQNFYWIRNQFIFMQGNLMNRQNMFWVGLMK